MYPYHLADLNFGCHYVSETRFQDVVLSLTRDKIRAALIRGDTNAFKANSDVTKTKAFGIGSASKNTFKKEEAADLAKICDV